VNFGINIRFFFFKKKKKKKSIIILGWFGAEDGGASVGP
jgi:hypothetical protein